VAAHALAGRSVAELARRAGGTVLDEDGLLLFAGAHRLPFLVNGVMRTGAGPPAVEVLARRAPSSTRGLGHRQIRAHADRPARRRRGRRAHAYGNAPGMVLERRLPDASPPPGVTLHRVDTPDDAVAFADVQGRAYATYGMPLDVTPLALGHLDVLRAPHIVTWLARQGGAPVAGAMVILSHGIAGIYWVGTVPEARGRGLAELVTRAAGNTGFDLGAPFVVLQASEMGDPVYRRMGYVEITRYPNMVQFTPP
jgi:ribosomal protein S18 acetylase RimI-like enzyme